ncbi:embryonic polarity protein dorsal-like [Culicoides brevitarsis]|uniref:embryonic polarity protein dorsal-like n=1 Tax=Culicoides brevitarsis TaxID=469753 RepID=UPI00307BB6D9
MANIDIFEQILVNNSSEAAAHLAPQNNVETREDENNNHFDLENNEINMNCEEMSSPPPSHDEQKVIEILDTPQNETNQFLEDDDKTLNELLEQVAELDEIYTDHQIQRDDQPKSFMDPDFRPVSLNNRVPSEKMDVDFDDAATYSSLQKAFKNPIDITLAPPVPQRPLHGQLIPEQEAVHHTYDAVEPAPMTVDARNAPKIDVQPMLKRENHEEEKLPPLPPKRARKLTETDGKSDKENENFPPITPSQSQILIKNADAPNKKLPPTPTKNGGGSATLPRQKKPGFFSKLFSRKKSKSDVNTQTPSTTAKTTPAASREPSVAAFELNDPNRGSFRSLKNPVIEDLKEGKPKTKVGKPVGRSVSSVSGKRPHLGPEIIHIPLKGDSTNSLPHSNPNLNAPMRHGTPQHSGYGSASTISLHALDKDRKTMSALQLADLPLKDGNMELVAIADAQSIKNLCEGDFGVQLDPDVNLSEAEHYALYTSIPPFATMSEIDENSMYYAPVEGGEILTPSEVAKRLTTLNKS